MNFLSGQMAKLEFCYSRSTSLLNRPRAFFLASIIIPVFFGLLSLLLGQDDNWDLRNYHLYNAYALLNDRVGFDMAPAQWQSYFNPALDLPYYLMTRYLPGPVTGFVFGLLHGLNFVLVLAIARLLLDEIALGDRYRVPLLLAVAGTMGAGFLSELGNSMGDNMMALLVLGALYIVLKHWESLCHDGRGTLMVIWSGLVMGLGVGLKLTNATYAVALCLAFFVVPALFWRRFCLAFAFGISVLVGISATAGYWFLKMWQTFGNPLFPQFNNIFHSPLAKQMGVIDTNYLPKNVIESLLWPFIFTLNFSRVSELVLKQAIWTVLYLLILLFFCKLLSLRFTGKGQSFILNPRTRFTLLFFGIAYLAWLKLFGIYRYLVPAELLAPLLVWILLHYIFPVAPARRIAGYLLTFIVIFVFPFSTWGHTSWAARSFSAQVPPISTPESRIVFIVHGDPPMGWLAQFFPKEVKFISLGSGFPESPAYIERVDSTIASRPGHHYVMLFAAKNYKEVSLQKKIAVVQWLGMTKGADGCSRLEWLMRRLRSQGSFKALPATATGVECTIELLSKHRMDLSELNRTTIATAGQVLGRYGLKLDAGSCTIYAAAIGSEAYPYQLCSVTKSP